MIRDLRAFLNLGAASLALLSAPAVAQDQTTPPEATTSAATVDPTATAANTQDTPDNGEISIKSWASENKIHLEIADTGIGIPEEDLPKIFQRFFRVDRSRSSEIEGTGLGLSIVQHLMHLLGGEITVSSNLNHGTTAHLIFPL